MLIFYLSPMILEKSEHKKCLHAFLSWERPTLPDNWDMNQGCFPHHPRLFTYDKLHVVKKKRKENFFLLLLGCLQVYSHSALPVSIVPVRILEIILLTKSSWDSLNFPYFIDNPLQLLWMPWRRCHPHHSKSGRIGEEEGQRTRFLNTFCELDASMEFSLFVDNMITLLCHLVCLLNVPSMEVP